MHLTICRKLTYWKLSSTTSLGFLNFKKVEILASHVFDALSRTHTRMLLCPLTDSLHLLRKLTYRKVSSLSGILKCKIHSYSTTIYCVSQQLKRKIQIAIFYFIIKYFYKIPYSVIKLYLFFRKTPYYVK